MKAVFFRSPLHPTLMSAVALSAVLSACTVVERPIVMRPPSERYGSPIYEQPSAAKVLDPAPVVSIYETAPLIQPAPLLVPWAPPPMLVQAPPPSPFFGATWVGGYWSWQGQWVWSAGHWVAPPSIGYVWTEPYYEHRGNAVVFVNGFWAAPGVTFIAPPPSLRLSLAFTLGGAIGSIAIGSQGVFVPPPPGSLAGIIVPAPIGTPPAVVVSAPAVVRPGMHIVNNGNVTINNNVTNITNVRNVTVIAPASATANHLAFQAAAPTHAALAAAQSAQTHWQAPLPQNAKPIAQAGVSGHPSTALPMAQTVPQPSAPSQTTPQSPMHAMSSANYPSTQTARPIAPQAVPTPQMPQMSKAAHQTMPMWAGNSERTSNTPLPSIKEATAYNAPYNNQPAYRPAPVQSIGAPTLDRRNFMPAVQTVHAPRTKLSTASRATTKQPEMPAPHQKTAKPVVPHTVATKPTPPQRQPKNKPARD